MKRQNRACIDRLKRLINGKGLEMVFQQDSMHKLTVVIKGREYELNNPAPSDIIRLALDNGIAVFSLYDDAGNEITSESLSTTNASKLYLVKTDAGGR